MTLERFSRPRAFIRIGSVQFQLELATGFRSGSRPRRVSTQGAGYRTTGQPWAGSQRPRGRGLSLVPQSFFRVLSGHKRGESSRREERESPTQVAGCNGNEKALVVDHRSRRWLATANWWSLEANNWGYGCWLQSIGRFPRAGVETRTAGCSGSNELWDLKWGGDRRRGREQRLRAWALTGEGDSAYRK